MGTEELHIMLFNRFIDNIRKVRDLEEKGYTIQDDKYCEGIAYWYYSPIGEQDVTMMKTYNVPAYPFGDWMLLGITLDGNIIHDSTKQVANMIGGRYYERRTEARIIANGTENHIQG